MTNNSSCCLGSGVTGLEETPRLREIFNKIIEYRDEINKLKQEYYDEIKKQNLSSFCLTIEKNRLEFHLLPEWERELLCGN